MSEDDIKDVLSQVGAAYLMDPGDSYCHADQVRHLVRAVEACATGSIDRRLSLTDEFILANGGTLLPGHAHALLDEPMLITEPWAPMTYEAGCIDAAQPQGSSVTVTVTNSVEPFDFDANRALWTWARSAAVGEMLKKLAVNGGCMGSEHGRRKARRAGAEAAAQADGVMPSDAPRVLAEASASLALETVAKALAADVVSRHLDKPARTLPGALSEASGGHRLGGWGASE